MWLLCNGFWGYKNITFNYPILNSTNHKKTLKPPTDRRTAGGTKEEEEKNKQTTNKNKSIKGIQCLINHV